MQAVQQQDFRALVEHHPRAIMLSTTEPRIAYVNRSFQAVTGYCQDEVLGEPPSVLSSGLHSRDFYRGMWESIHTNGRWEGLIWNRRKNGETYPQWLSIYPVIQGSRRFYAGVFMDVGDPAAGDERLASLAYLHTLPVQVLKIDRQFTRQLGTDARDARIVSAILGIAEALGLEVVAEGIESEQQLEKLRQLRCHRGQGYLLGKPLGWGQVVDVLIDGHQIRHDYVAS